jgi:membrane protein DedA with SNARE-associated domain
MVKLALSLIANLFLFLIALVSNATPFFGASYVLLATMALYNYGITITGFSTVVVVTAVASSIGKLVLYATGKLTKNKLEKSRNFAIFHQWLEQSNKSSLLLVFATGLVPVVPLDDYVYIAAGAGGAKLGAMFATTLLAKLLKNGLEISFAIWGLRGLFTMSLLGMSHLETSMLFSSLLLLGGVALYRVDFIRLAERIRTMKNPITPTTTRSS